MPPKNMYVVVLKKRADKQFERLPDRDQTRILLALQSLREDPFSGKKLDGDLDGFYVIRIWPYRIMYIIEKKIVTVTVVAIGHRKDVYRGLR